MNEGMPGEALQPTGQVRGKRAQDGEAVMLSDSKGGTLWRSGKAGNGAGPLILHRGTRSRKGRRCRACGRDCSWAVGVCLGLRWPCSWLETHQGPWGGG